MQAFKDLFSKSSNDAEPSASVLAEWNTYASEEASGSAPSQKDRLLGDTTRKMEEGAAAVGKFLGTSFKTVSTQVQTGVSGAAASVATGVQSISLPSTTQLVYFAAILGSGLLLLALAFFLFLPVIILAPSKFAMTFSLGSICILSSVGALRGWKEQLQHMISRERLPFTAAYLTSVLGTLYASLVMHSYIFSLLCCAFQIAALLYYLMSYFPGGSTGARFMLGVIGKGITQAFSACTRAILR